MRAVHFTMNVLRRLLRSAWAISVASALLMSGCDAKERPVARPSDDREIRTRSLLFNETRSRLGLRPVGEQWILYRSDSQQDEWKTQVTGGIAKLVVKDEAGNPIREVDRYVSGKEYEDHEGHDYESVTVTYDYRARQLVVSYQGTNDVIIKELSNFNLYIITDRKSISEALSVVAGIVDSWPSQ